MRLETERLVIRSLEAGDAEPLASLWTDPEVTRHLGGPRDFAEIRIGLEVDAESHDAAEFDQWPVVEKASGRVIGHCGLLAKNVDGRQEIELVYVISRACWGKGYATEAAEALGNHAFQTQGLRRLVSLIEPGNITSERVAEKVGMHFERETVRPGGRVMRVYSMESGHVNEAG